MKFTGSEIRTLRQRLGWSMAEMGRRMGCSASLIGNWESGKTAPDAEDMNQLVFLQDHVNTVSEQTAQKPVIEKEMQSRGIEQLTHRDLLKDFQ